MKKIIFLLLLVALSLCAACLIVYWATPALVATSTMFKGASLATNALGIPHWIGLLLAFSLLPTGVIMAVRAFSPKFRRWTVIVFIILAVAYALVAATSSDKLVSAAHNALISIQRFCIPIKSADPATEAWFYHDGKPRLFYTRPATNTWAFYRGAYLGAHDPVTGAELEPVTPSIREEWQVEQTSKRETEIAKEKQATQAALKVQRQQLESTEDSLRAEKSARLRDRDAFIGRLLKHICDKQIELTAAETNLPTLPLQPVSDAQQKLAAVQAMLMDVMTNNSPIDLAVVQSEAEATTSNVDLAEIQIQAASAAQEKAKQVATDTAAAKLAVETKEQQDAAESKRLADERQQSELSVQKNAATEKERQQTFSSDSNTSQNELGENQSQTHIGLRSRFRHSLGQDSVVTVTMQNTTGYTLYITFSSPKWQHIWPEEGRAFVADPGETVNIGLRGFLGEQIFYKAWAAQNPNLQWNACDCGENGQPSPIAICGDDDPPLLRLVEQPQQLSFDGRGF